MELNELQNRLTNIITGISNLGPRIIQGITQGFIKYYIPDQIWVISITDIEYYTWDEDEDDPIPGIKLFKDLNIYLEREFCEY